MAGNEDPAGFGYAAGGYEWQFCSTLTRTGSISMPRRPPSPGSPGPWTVDSGIFPSGNRRASLRSLARLRIHGLPISATQVQLQWKGGRRNMVSKHITTKKMWDSTPKRDSSTRYVKRENNGHAAERSKPSGRDLDAETQNRIAELPPPGPSNIMVTTASILPPPKRIGSE